MSRLRSNCQIGQDEEAIQHLSTNPFRILQGIHFSPFSAWGLESANLGWSANRATKWRHGTTQFRQKDPGAEVCGKFEGRKSQPLMLHINFTTLIHPIPAILWSNQRFVTQIHMKLREIVQVMGWQSTGDQAKFCITNALLVVYL